jgi:DNA-binding LytR/AlgR family response regulator
LKGLDFLKTLKNPPAVIVTTAYHEYALQGYEYNITDYLLKPVEFTRFLTAVNKIRNSGARISNPAARPAERKSYFFNANKKKVKIFFDEILYVESLREYIRIVTKSKSVITKLPLGQIEELLSDGSFIRVHRSFIVSINKIDIFSTTDVEINGKQIPVGRHFKDSLLLALGSGDH